MRARVVILTTSDDQKFLSRFFRKQFLIKVPKLLSVNENLQCERNSVKNSVSTINPSFTLKNRFAWAPISLLNFHHKWRIDKIPSCAPWNNNKLLKHNTVPPNLYEQPLQVVPNASSALTIKNNMNESCKQGRTYNFLARSHGPMGLQTCSLHAVVE